MSKAEATVLRHWREGDGGGGGDDQGIRQWCCPNKKSSHKDVINRARCLARRVPGIQKRRVVAKISVTKLKC